MTGGVQLRTNARSGTDLAVLKLKVTIGVLTWGSAVGADEIAELRGGRGRWEREDYDGPCRFLAFILGARNILTQRL